MPMSKFTYGHLLWFGDPPVPPEPSPYLLGWNPALSKFKPYGLPVKKLARCSRASAQFVQETKQMMERVPAGIVTALKSYGLAVIPVADIFDCVEWLSFAGPRGHDGKGSWQRIAGLCMFDGHLLLLGSHRINERGYYVPVQDAQATFNHELGHCLDAALKYISQSREFLECVAADIEKIKGSDLHFYRYLLQGLPAGPSEIFAECFAFTQGAHCLQLRTRSLSEYFPSSCQFVKELVDRLSSTTNH